jgi:UDP-2,3-diacylglucosamine pyrophosphatase LpxH
MDDERDGRVRFRTIWISDLHLGTAGCQARLLLEFLRHTESEYLYLVGDIVDGWQLRRRWYWPQTHNDVVQKILRKARKGTSVIFIPGNHDEFGRHFLKLSFGGIEVREEAVHVTAVACSWCTVTFSTESSSARGGSRFSATSCTTSCCISTDG